MDFKLNIVIAYSKHTYRKIKGNLLDKISGINIYEINNKDQLTMGFLESINPKYIFFPHWSYIIPKEIYTNYECVVFHMTNLPFGRGGSPLQNLISNGIYDTKISALKCEKELDGGPIYLKKSFHLYGNAEEIYLRAAYVIQNMIEVIVKTNPIPIIQSGEVTTFTRRKSEESNVESIEELNKMFDFIRMLDAEGYPKAFIETKHFKLEFSRASLKENEILADVRIVKKGDNE